MTKLKIFFVFFMVLLLISCTSTNVKKEEIKSLEVKDDLNNSQKEINKIYLNENNNIPQKIISYLIKGENKIKYSSEYDFNNDGMIDTMVIFEENGNISKIYSDLDYDRKEDIIDIYSNNKITERQIKNHINNQIYIWKIYDDKGLILTKDIDDNLDGKKNIQFRYINGQLAQKLTDINNDGVMDNTQIIKQQSTKTDEK